MTSNILAFISKGLSLHLEAFDLGESCSDRLQVFLGPSTGP